MVWKVYHLKMLRSMRNRKQVVVKARIVKMMNQQLRKNQHQHCWVLGPQRSHRAYCPHQWVLCLQGCTLGICP